MTMNGMTGFARREGTLDAWTWAVEARSVNGRNLEVRFRGPPGFEGLERVAREAAQARFPRGQLGIGLQARRADAPSRIRINHELLAGYLAALEPLIQSGKVAPPSADGLLALRGVVEAPDLEDDPERRAALEAAMARDIVAALDELSTARSEEGRALTALIAGFLDQIASLTEAAISAADAQPALIRDRFARRLEELLGEAAPADRILIEAAAMATRADVREELDRLTAHIASARALLAEVASAGRRLDFLAQEFMREANTLTSKSASPALTAVGLELKAVIDRMREQVQNVE
ncbi:MAG: YicC/YloC family endoribonuclease [Caulobacteraceae bacterium]